MERAEQNNNTISPIVDKETLLDAHVKLKTTNFTKQPMTNGNLFGPRVFRPYRPGTGSSESQDGRFVSIEQYNGLKKQLTDSEDRAQHLQQLNDTLNQEVNLLRSMVQKLMQENASLRAQVTQANSNRDGVEKQMIEMQRHMNEMIMTSRVDETDSDHVPIASISPHPSPGASQSFFEETPPPPQPNIESHLEMRLQNPYDNVGLSNSTPMYSKPNREENKSRIQSEVSSVTSQKSNGIAPQHSPQEYPASSDDSTAFITEEDETPLTPQQTESLPTQESIVKATEQITKKIQELLLAAQGSRHSRYIPCASNISTAVNDMANLFPKHPSAENQRSALRLMITSAARLQVECRSSVLPDRTIDAAMLTQQVIQCAYDIAKAAKQLVMTYNQE